MIPRRPGASKLASQSDLLRRVTYIAVCTFAIPSSLRYAEGKGGMANVQTAEEDRRNGLPRRVSTHGGEHGFLAEQADRGRQIHGLRG